MELDISILRREYGLSERSIGIAGRGLRIAEREGMLQDKGRVI